MRQPLAAGHLELLLTLHASCPYDFKVVCTVIWRVQPTYCTTILPQLGKLSVGQAPGCSNGSRQILLGECDANACVQLLDWTHTVELLFPGLCPVTALAGVLFNVCLPALWRFIAMCRVWPASCLDPWL